ncbi:hypothetical protein NDU88_000354 [Pleurodeles waltl]|uniref:Uncharacterized protein n=1 Tax=Pleurodeles waltl TaxID=8319 RepID=A0AAV7KQG4_PLEWA|nr:hypothetical protein NDU88_000354 [Pleurodeles waltl]
MQCSGDAPEASRAPYEASALTASCPCSQGPSPAFPRNSQPLSERLNTQKSGGLIKALSEQSVNVVLTSGPSPVRRALGPPFITLYGSPGLRRLRRHVCGSVEVTPPTDTRDGWLYSL